MIAAITTAELQILLALLGFVIVSIFFAILWTLLMGITSKPPTPKPFPWAPPNPEERYQ